MKSDVFTSFIDTGEIFDFPKLSREEEDKILAGFFEQLLIFDRVIISTTRNNDSAFKLRHLSNAKFTENGLMRLEKTQMLKK